MSDKDYMRESIERGLVVQYNRGIADALDALNRLDAEGKILGSGGFYMRQALAALYRNYTPAQAGEAGTAETPLSGSAVVAKARSDEGGNWPQRLHHPPIV